MPREPALAPEPVRAPQRPAGITMACTMAVMASLQFICVLGFAWLVAYVGREQFNPADPGEGPIYHLLNRFQLRLMEGLAWPLFVIPGLTLIVSFLVLIRRGWGRAIFTLLGIASLSWSAWWLRFDLRWWIAPAVYIAFCCVIVWTPSASRWYAWPDQQHSGPESELR